MQQDLHLVDLSMIRVATGGDSASCYVGPLVKFLRNTDYLAPESQLSEN